MSRWITIGLIVLAVAAIGFIVALSMFATFRAVTVDVSIVLLAAFQMIATIMLITILLITLYVLNRLEKLSRETFIPKIDQLTTKVNELVDTVSPRVDTVTARFSEIVDDTKETSNQVRNTAGTTANTTVFIAERVVSPIIRASSMAAGVRAAASALARRQLPPDNQ